MAAQEPDTEGLLRLAAQGEQSAVAQLLMRHQGRLRQMVAVRLVPRLKARIDPSDVVQETLLEAATKLPEFLRDRPMPYYPWLRQIAWQRLHALHLHHVSAQKRSVDREQDDDMGLSDESVVQLARQIGASGTSPSANLLRKELRRTVRQALDRMKSEDREVLVLRHLEQLDVRDIAVILAISEEAVAMRHLRALKRLRDLLRPFLGES